MRKKHESLSERKSGDAAKIYINWHFDRPRHLHNEGLFDVCD